MIETLHQRITRAGRIFDDAIQHSALALLHRGHAYFASADKLQQLFLLRNKTLADAQPAEILDLRHPDARQTFITWAVAQATQSKGN